LTYQSDRTLELFKTPYRYDLAVTKIRRQHRHHWRNGK
jgi:hypothetical protein